MGNLKINCVTYVVYAPSIISSPWARLITPIRPKTIARPNAATSNTDPIATPLKRLSRSNSNLKKKIFVYIK